ncbi:bidirectional hydrogenase complex protein HoxU [Trichormus azollae]|jgi:bidirectional [NiFe] hydrogenase diaphorase subunit|uniref:NADH:ubiquinone oxidoreductase, subunit G, iron-sulfur binding protein n=1 Tax=Nostoc azollae (strain 0708) TaxID=551115 RepID=D7DW67_NOSA0|nr:bidirectional hydrogenase complex protein HoxU [Trichormus azollae]ADI65638.1 NADH:ubiquinone oxidoreductase, subunit G, iron-sulfur binding protein ['Nostoc azollae' 0708]
MSVKTLTINGELVSAREDETLLEAAKGGGVHTPTLCHLDGVGDVGPCRLCLLEIAGSNKLHPACLRKVAEGIEVNTHSARLQKYRRTIIEMSFAEGNHICSVCVANGNCELQDLAIEMGMDHVRIEYQLPNRTVDTSHDHFGIGHDRCVLCNRCVRVCDEIEGAHTWEMVVRWSKSHVITDLNQPWGTSQTCTSCGKYVNACPTGAIFYQGSSVGEIKNYRSKIDF